MQIASTQSNCGRKRYAKMITKAELFAFFEQLLIAGVKKASHASFLELWATDETGIEICRACMSYDQFLFLLSTISFDDKKVKINPLNPGFSDHARL